MVIAGRAETIKLVTAQTETLSGYPREELIGCPVEILVSRAVPRSSPGPPAE